MFIYSSTMLQSMHIRRVVVINLLFILLGTVSFKM